MDAKTIFSKWPRRQAAAGRFGQSSANVIDFEIGGLRQRRMDRMMGPAPAVAQDAAAAPGIGEPAPDRLGEMARPDMV